jgi:hypothetical protein
MWRQRQCDDRKRTIGTSSLLPPSYCHVVVVTAPAWHTPHPHPALGAWPARLRVCNGNMATTTTQQLQPHHRHVVIVTAVLQCARTHASYRSLCATHACLPSLHIRKLPYTYTGFENGDQSMALPIRLLGAALRHDYGIYRSKGILKSNCR